MKILGLGLSQYLHSGWNFCDLIVTCLSLLALFAIYVVPSFYFGVVVRPLRLLHLFKVSYPFRFLEVF